MLGLEQKPSPHEFLQIGTMHWFPPGRVFQPGQQYEWNREPHTLGPLSVSWPRRRTRCTSLCSVASVKRLAWYAPVPVCELDTWTAPRNTAAHPRSTWASIMEPIALLVLQPRLAHNPGAANRPRPHWGLDLDPHQVPGSTPEQGLQQLKSLGVKICAPR